MKNYAKQFIGVISAFAASLTFAAVDSPRVDNDPVPHVSGGVTFEARREMEQLKRDFNLRLVFVDKKGAYLADIHVTVLDEHGKPVLSAISEGPLFYAKLPRGTYTVVAEAANVEVRQSIKLHDPKQVVLRWTQEVSGT